MRSHLLPGTTLVLVFSQLLLMVCFANTVFAQKENGLGDNEADPVKLFDRAQNAHAHGDLLKALEFYEEAIKVKPEFPEAEFQRGNALVTLGRLGEAESAFQRAIQLRSGWSLPHSALGALLVRLNRDREAELLLRRALALDAKDNVTLRMLADVRLRAGDAKEALELAKHATNDAEAPASAWLVRALAERATGDKATAKTSLDHVLQIDPESIAALVERAEISLEDGHYEHAIQDLKAAEQIKKGDKQILSRLSVAYEHAGKPEEARRIAESAGLVSENQTPDGTISVVGTPQEIQQANSDDPIEARKALEKLLQKNPNNAMLLARLGGSYRTVDPDRSLDFYRRAAEIEPNNSDYAVGYASALVQARRFAAAVIILRRVVKLASDSYAARANLATALYELKRYAEALPEYEWLLKSKPDLAIAYYFIATAHDYLGEYEQALPAYEAFLIHAGKANQLEIDKVNLRLPSLKRQIQLGQGTKRKQ